MQSMKQIFDNIYIDSLTPIKFADGLKAYSDKNTNHRYIDNLYEELFKDIRNTTSKILEIGIYGGGSMLLWQKYFPNADIYGIDLSYFVPELVGLDRVTQIIGNAYSTQITSMLSNEEFDIVIDDGPHTLESFELFIQKYLPKVKTGGYLIIEDIYDIDVAYSLIKLLPEEYRDRVKIHDFRHIANLFDDIIFVLKK